MAPKRSTVLMMHVSIVIVWESLREKQCSELSCLLCLPCSPLRIVSSDTSMRRENSNRVSPRRFRTGCANEDSIVTLLIQ